MTCSSYPRSSLGGHSDGAGRGKRGEYTWITRFDEHKIVGLESKKGKLRGSDGIKVRRPRRPVQNSASQRAPEI